MRKPRIESRAMKYKPRIDREEQADAGFVLRETRLYRRKRMTFYRSTLVRILATIRISAPQMRVAI